jgi:ribonuclease HII
MKRLKYEKDLFEKGHKYIAGIDEAGRGPLAGPLVVAAVILDIEKILDLMQTHTNNDVGDEILESYKEIRDSKLLSKKKRGRIRDFITNECISYSIAEIPHNVIDEEGIMSATQIGFYQVIKNIGIKPNYILTDFFEILKITKEHQLNIRHGDNKSITVAAASIIAKEHRDEIMINAHEMYPKYHFHKHKGYGTKFHREAIHKFGPCPIHRKTFEPTKSLLKVA